MRIIPKKTSTIRRILVVLSLLGILTIRMIPHVGEFYARHLYPSISGIVSWVSSIVPYSLTEWIVVVVIATLLLYPIYAHRKKISGKHILAIEAEIVCWMVIWFYVGWALNYYRDSLYERAHIEPCKANKTEFRSFLLTYIDSLNANYMPLNSIDEEEIQAKVKKLYAQIPEEYGLVHSFAYQHPKKPAFNRLYSAVGVLGYMGPFADESHLNAQLPPVQYAFTYAHELSHLLSISNEAEANFWAFEICIHSSDKTIRYSGYYGILTNVLNNARAILGENEYKIYTRRIDKRILKQSAQVHDFWKSQHCALLDEIQDTLFNALLKGNKIPSGMTNYNEVVETIISFEMNKHKKTIDYEKPID